jgi:hypothetical protein
MASKAPKKKTPGGGGMGQMQMLKQMKKGMGMKMNRHLQTV